LIKAAASTVMAIALFAAQPHVFASEAVPQGPDASASAARVKSQSSLQPRSIGAKSGGASAAHAELPLPGLGVLPGATQPEFENNVIRVTPSRTEVVNVSATLMNRIATPFAAPKAIMLDGAGTVTAQGQSLFVALNGSPDPVSFYVTGSDPNDPTYSLTLVPQSMPQQTIVLQMDGAAMSGGVGASVGRDDNPNSPIYTEKIISILRSVALGKTPEGFVEGRLPSAVGNFGAFTAIPLSRVSSSTYDVYRYRLVTESETTIELNEAAFASQGVRAVAFFPSALIARNVPTEVYVVADKQATRIGGR
jgi:conjugal transfer pilus assembly protein TraK